MRSLTGDVIKSAITLRDCLTMTAGLDWDEWRLPYTDRRNVLVAMNHSADPVRYVLDRPRLQRQVPSSHITVVSRSCSLR